MGAPVKSKTGRQPRSQSRNLAPSRTEAEKLFESIVKTFSRDRAISQSRMFGSSGLKVGGKVFAMLVTEKLVVKLPKERVENLVRSGKGSHFDPGHGRVMTEWVAVETSGGDWFDLASEARIFVGPGRS